MCAIFGAIGKKVPLEVLCDLRQAASDRGRDGGRMERFEVTGGELYLGNWRATPTTERKDAPLQPYNGVVHNGTIANDKELGGLPGEVDSMVLGRCLDRSHIGAFRESLGKVKGSYALAAAAADGVFLACNYKPLWILDDKEAGVLYFSSLERHLAELGRGAPFQLEPYTVGYFDAARRCIGLRLDLDYGRGTVVVASAGLDSTVVATMAAEDGGRVHLLHFQYGCNAETRELERVRRIAEALELEHTVITLPDVFGKHKLNAPEAETTDGVAGSEYAHEWVPARNLVMLSTAVAFAEAHGYGRVALGNNLEEAGAYPDNEEEFIIEMNKAVRYATQNGRRVEIIQPVGHLMKHEIVREGLRLGAPLEHTWSCYRGGDTHCGKCGPCFMRKTAFARNNAVDPVMPKEQP